LNDDSRAGYNTPEDLEAVNAIIEISDA